MADDGRGSVDHDLVRGAVGMDPEAWEQVYRRSYAPLLGYARRRLSSSDAAEDAVSETMIRAMDSISRYQPRDGAFNAWLFGICRNVVLETHRRSGRTEPLTTNGEGPPTADASEGLLALEDCRRMRQAFGQLSDPDRELLELRVVAGLTSEGVGSVLGQRPGTVRMAQTRALDRLKHNFEEVRGGF